MSAPETRGEPAVSPSAPVPARTRKVSAVFSHIAAPNEGGVSFLDLLLRRFPYHDREQWLERIRSGRVRLEGLVADPDTRLAPKMRLEYRVDDYEEPAVPIDFRELARAGDLALVHKPAGLPVHKTGKVFVNVLANLYKEFAGDRTWAPLNRLDVETSGIVAFARGPEAARRFSPGNPQTAWTKTYLAVVHGEITAAGRIDGPLAEKPGDPIRSRMHVMEGGKEAATLYRPLAVREGHSLLEVTLLTGRKHQIRAHLASIGHPVLGDKMYSLDGRYYLKRLEGELTDDDLETLGAPHQLLHAYELKISDETYTGITTRDDFLPAPFLRYFPQLAEPDSIAILRRPL